MPKMMQNRMCAPGKSRRGIGGVLRELFTYSNKLKAPSVAAFCFAVAGAVLTIIGPSLLSRITDLISDALDGEIDLAAIGRTGVILLVIYGFSAVFTYVEHFIMATVTLELSRDMRPRQKNGPASIGVLVGAGSSLRRSKSGSSA